MSAIAPKLLCEAYTLLIHIGYGRAALPSGAELEARPDFYSALEFAAKKLDRGRPASPAPPPVREAPKTEVYFIQIEGLPFVKIGISRGKAGRLSTFQTACPLQVCVLATCDGDIAKERQLHQRFGHLRERGEWFRLEPELQTFIDSVEVQPEPHQPNLKRVKHCPSCTCGRT